MTADHITPELVNDLLVLTSTEAQMALLDSAGVLNPDGLSDLLDFTGELVGNDPGQARRLGLVCEAAAEAANAPLLVPRATYLRAQTHAIDGEFAQASALIRSSAKMN